MANKIQKNLLIDLGVSMLGLAILYAIFITITEIPVNTTIAKIPVNKTARGVGIHNNYHNIYFSGFRSDEVYK